MNRTDLHFDEMTALLYLDGQLEAGRADEVTAHATSCLPCGSLLGALQKEGAWLRGALVAEEEAVPARLLAAPGRSTGPWGWMVTFGLGVAGVYTLWSGLVEPWLNEAAQAGFTGQSLLTMLFFSGAFWKGWDAMQSLVEFLALGTLTTVVIWLLHKQWRRFTPVVFVMGVLACALALPPAAAAAEIRRGDPSYTLPAGQEVKNDLMVAAGTARIEGDVDGDLIVFATTVTVTGHVKGDILCFAQTLRVEGPVDGNVRVMAEALTLNGTVGKNVMTWAGTMELGDKASVGGTMTIFTGEAELNGRIAGDLLALAGDLDINGTLGHDATIRGNRVAIGPAAQIAGKTKYTGPQEPTVSPGAKLGSPPEITIQTRGPSAPNYASPHYYLHRVLLWGASFLFGLVMLLLAPQFCLDAKQESKRVGPAVGFGVLFLIATPIAAILACCTVVGLGVGIAALLLYAIALYSTPVIVGLWVGEALLGAAPAAPSATGPIIGRMALGVGILQVAGMVPFVGFWIRVGMVIWGLGALVLALYARIRSTQAVTA